MEIFELILSEKQGEGVTAISLVKRPAIEEKWIAMSAEERRAAPIRFKVTDTDKRLVAGPAMIPDKLMPRQDGDEIYQVYFSSDTIRSLAEKFFIGGKTNSITLEHEATLNDISVVESWIVADPKKDKSAAYGFSLPAGTWFVIMKILDDEIWELVKSKEVEGFSVEGYFMHQLIKQSKNIDMSKIDQYLEKIRSAFVEKAEEKPAEKTEEQQEFATVTLTDTDGNAHTVQYEADELAAGVALYVTDEDGVQMPLPDGSYTLEDGRVVVVADGILAEIAAVEAEETVEEQASMSDEQLDALVNAISDVLSKFAEQTAELEERIDTKLAALREEFSKPGGNPERTVPGQRQEMSAKGLGAYVREQLKNA